MRENPSLPFCSLFIFFFLSKIPIVPFIWIICNFSPILDFFQRASLMKGHAWDGGRREGKNKYKLHSHLFIIKINFICTLCFSFLIFLTFLLSILYFSHKHNNGSKILYLLFFILIFIFSILDFSVKHDNKNHFFFQY